VLPGYKMSVYYFHAQVCLMQILENCDLTCYTELVFLHMMRSAGHIARFGASGSREDPRPLVTASSVIMIVVHSVEVSTLYPRVLISSPFDD
jgi:hypothetical protein